MTSITVFPPADLYARLDGLRAFIAAALADETADQQTALEFARADLEQIVGEAPAWCGGCAARGGGLVCLACGAPVPARYRRGLTPEEIGEALARAAASDGGWIAARPCVRGGGAREWWPGPLAVLRAADPDATAVWVDDPDGYDLQVTRPGVPAIRFGVPRGSDRS